jgi:FkbM family methyltransferase
MKRRELLRQFGWLAVTAASTFLNFKRAIIWVLMRAPAQLFLFKCYHHITKLAVPAAIAQTRFGSKLYCDPKDFIQSMIYHFGIWEPNVSWVIEQLLSDGDVVADIGANIGYDSLLSSKAIGESGTVVSIEAAPATFDLLKSNLALNNVQNVRALNLAVSDEHGCLTLYTGDSTNIGNSSAIKSDERTIEVTVDARPLDEVLTEDERKNLRLIKMDIEGGEPAVLRRFLRTLNLYGPRTCLIVEASPQFDRSSWLELFDAFSAAGFSAYGIENSYSPVWYLNWRKPSAPHQLHAMPEEQTDILFIKEQLPSALRAPLLEGRAAVSA